MALRVALATKYAFVMPSQAWPRGVMCDPRRLMNNVERELCISMMATAYECFRIVRFMYLVELDPTFLCCLIPNLLVYEIEIEIRELLVDLASILVLSEIYQQISLLNGTKSTNNGCKSWISRKEHESKVNAVDMQALQSI